MHFIFTFNLAPADHAGVLKVEGPGDVVVALSVVAQHLCCPHEQSQRCFIIFVSSDHSLKNDKQTSDYTYHKLSCLIRQTSHTLPTSPFATEPPPPPPPPQSSSPSRTSCLHRVEMCYISGQWHLLWVILSNQIHYTCCESSCETRPVDKSSCETRQTSCETRQTTSRLIKPDRLRVVLSNQRDYESSCQTRKTTSHLVRSDTLHLLWVILSNQTDSTCHKSSCLTRDYICCEPKGWWVWKVSSG